MHGGHDFVDTNHHHHRGKHLGHNDQRHHGLFPGEVHSGQSVAAGNGAEDAQGRTKNRHNQGVFEVGQQRYILPDVDVVFPVPYLRQQGAGDTVERIEVLQGTEEHDNVGIENKQRHHTGEGVQEDTAQLDFFAVHQSSSFIWVLM